ncbi:MAG: 50S ribosomal protein L10 [Candidatus Omnitrophota bacterium]
MKKQGLGFGCKETMAKEMKEKLAKCSQLFVTTFRTMPVVEQEELRRRLKEIKASLFVVKHRIVRHVFKELDMESLNKMRSGMTAIALGEEQSNRLPKVLLEFAAKNENFKVFAGYWENQLLDLPTVKRLATMPSREVLLAQVFGGFKLPIQGLVNTLAATMRGVVIVLNKISEKKQ